MFNEIKRSLLGAVFLALPLAANAATVINFDTDGLGNPDPGLDGDHQPICQSRRLVPSPGRWRPGRYPRHRRSRRRHRAEQPRTCLLTALLVALVVVEIRADIVRIGFLTSVSQISLQLNTLGASSSVTFQLFDGLNNVLETQTVTSGKHAVRAGLFRSLGRDPDRWLRPLTLAWAIDDLTSSRRRSFPCRRRCSCSGPGCWALRRFAVAKQA